MKLFIGVVVTTVLSGGFLVSCAHESHAAPVMEKAEVSAKAEPEAVKTKEPIKKVLFIGDSMTGWMAERLNAYGQKNGFEVATVVWDGSTIEKWASSPKLKTIVETQNPDAVFVSMGMNELFERNPERLQGYVDKILSAVGDRDLLWVGPPSWPGHKEGKLLNDFLEKNLGDSRFYRSSDLNLERQSAKNPHPSKAGIIKWMDAVMDWIPSHTSLEFHSLEKPASSAMSRGNVFIYKRMNEKL